MSEMTPFERQVGEEMRHEMGAPPEFDPLAIARQAATATKADGWSTITRWLPGGRATRAERGLSMFTAAKLVAATAVVALFGGFLLINVTPMPQGEEVIRGR